MGINEIFKNLSDDELERVQECEPEPISIDCARKVITHLLNFSGDVGASLTLLNDYDMKKVASDIDLLFGQFGYIWESTDLKCTDHLEGF